MILYTPLYDHGHKCETIADAEKLKMLTGSSVCRNGGRGIGFYGRIYSAFNLYTDPAAVGTYWRGDPVPESMRYHNFDATEV